VHSVKAYVVEKKMLSLSKKGGERGFVVAEDDL